MKVNIPACTPGTARAAHNVQGNENTSEFKLQAGWPSPTPKVLRFCPQVLNATSACQSPVPGCNLLWNSQTDTVCLQPWWPDIYVQMLWAMNFSAECNHCRTPLSPSRHCSLWGPAIMHRNQRSSGVKKPDLWLIWVPSDKTSPYVHKGHLAMEMRYRDGWQTRVSADLH